MNILFGLLFTVALALPVEKNSENKVGMYGDYFEGDMVLNEEQIEDLLSPARNGLIKKRYRWTNKTVPYLLSDEHTKEQNDYIELALKAIESVSCIKFVRRTNEEEYIEMNASDKGCHSSVGMQPGGQILNLESSKLEKDCFRFGVIIHEFLHALGFHHMQSAYDRDEYVTIHTENMMPGTKNQFRKYTSKEVTHFNTTYDYLSLMHYSAYAYSKNGLPTIVPVDEKYLNVIGQVKGMSEKDIIKLNAMYECTESTKQQ